MFENEITDFILEHINSINSSSIFIYPNIPEKKIEKANEAYLGLKLNNILALYDDTLFGGGDEGIVFTDESLIWLNGKKWPYIEPPIMYEDLESVDSGNGYIIVNDIFGNSITIDNLSFIKPLELKKFINGIIKIVKKNRQEEKRKEDIEEFILTNKIKIKELVKINQQTNKKIIENAISDDAWLGKIWKWANENEIPETKLSRDKEKLTRRPFLMLDDLNLKNIPKEIGYLNNLNILHLEDNQLEEIPKEIGYLNNLEDLHLQNNKLKKLPEEIGNLSNLTNLNLENNQIKRLPKEIGYLSNLTSLYLENNQIKRLPKEIGYLSNLEYLHLENNKLKKLPEEIGFLLSLTNLYLYNNQIKRLPKEIGLLSSLIKLSLEGNQLEEIPKEIGSLSNLTHLNLEDNMLEKIPEEVSELCEKNNIYMY